MDKKLKQKIALAKKFILKKDKQKREVILNIFGVNGNVVGTDGHACVIIPEETLNQDKLYKYNFETELFDEVIYEDNNPSETASACQLVSNMITEKMKLCNRFETGILINIAKEEDKSENLKTTISELTFQFEYVQKKYYVSDDLFLKILKVYNGIPCFYVDKEFIFNPIMIKWKEGCEKGQEITCLLMGVEVQS